MTGLTAELLHGGHGDLELEVATVLESGRETLRVGVLGAQARTLLERLHASEGSPRLRLVDLTVVDRRDEARPGLEVVYRLETDEPAGSLRVHARLPVGTPGDDAEEPGIESVAGLWPAAGWLEREARELFGVRFRGVASGSPLLLDPGPDGPPLRRGGATAEGGSSPIPASGGGSA